MQQIDANGLQIERNGQLQALTDLTELMPGDKLINNTNQAVTIQLPKAEGSPTLKVGPGGAVTFSENPESLGGEAGDLLVQNWEGPVELAVEEGGAGAASSLFGGLSGAGVLAAAGGTLLVASVAGGGGGGGSSDGTTSTDTTAESSFVPTSPTSFSSGGNQVVTEAPKDEKEEKPSEKPEDEPEGSASPLDTSLLEAIVESAQEDGATLQDSPESFSPTESATADTLQTAIAQLQSSGDETDDPASADSTDPATQLESAIDEGIAELEGATGTEVLSNLKESLPSGGGDSPDASPITEAIDAATEGTPLEGSGSSISSAASDPAGSITSGLDNLPS